MSVGAPSGPELVLFVGTWVGVALRVVHASRRIAMHRFEIHGPPVAWCAHKMGVFGLELEARSTGSSVDRSDELGSPEAGDLGMVEYREEHDWPQ